jgi:hypothetical protein
MRVRCADSAADAGMAVRNPCRESIRVSTPSAGFRETSLSNRASSGAAVQPLPLPATTLGVSHDRPCSPHSCPARRSATSYTHAGRLDPIVVIEDGAITDDGPPAELIDSDGAYARPRASTETPAPR